MSINFTCKEYISKMIITSNWPDISILLIADMVFATPPFRLIINIVVFCKPSVCIF